MKTVVTGGAGLIGSHLVKRLLDEGREVVVADDFSRGTMLNLSDLGVRIQCEEIDLRDYHQASRVLAGVDVVFHLAARVGSIEYLHHDEMAELRGLQDNLLIDANVLRACAEESVEKIIYTSSVSVYPLDVQQKENVVLSEDDLRSDNPEGGYGWAKLLGEMQLGWMKAQKVGIARIFNVYGGGEPLENSHVIPALIRKAIRYPEEDFIVWGDGNQSRCLLYVTDCVDALMRLEERISKGDPLTVNLGSDVSVSVREMAEKIAEISGKNITPKFDPSKPAGPKSRTADISKARAVLGWSPTVPLDEGLKRTYLWTERRLQGSR